MMVNVIKTCFCLMTVLLFTVPSFAQADKREVRSGNRRFESGKYREAEVAYRKALLKDSLSMAGNYNLASALYLEKNYDEAGKVLENVKEIAPMTKDASAWHYNTGDVALQKKDYAAAVKAFRESLLLNPGDLEAKENYIYAKKMLDDRQNGGGQNQQNQDQDNNQDQNNNQNQDQKNDPNQDRQDSNQQNGQRDISPQQAQQMLKAIQAQEKKTQDKVDKEKAAALKSRQKEKNW